MLYLYLFLISSLNVIGGIFQEKAERLAKFK